MTGGSAVEDEILALKLDNTQFERAATTSLSTFEKLKATLSKTGGDLGSGLDNVSKNIRGFNMNPLVDSASEVGKAFSSMSVIAISAIATLASQATTAGLGLAKSLTISPVASGFAEYGTQLNSIQTIMANTGLEGQRGLDKVNAALNQLNEYSDKTIYNFTEMARNIGTFSAAGVDLDTSTAAIKGIANVAAVSGSNSQQASTAMYQLSQALASGSVKLMDWNSVVNAGMGGKVFKDSIMETARAHGVAIDDMIKQDGSFRDTLQRGWFSADILTETLSKFTGDLSQKQLVSMGYTVKQAKDIEKMGMIAQDAATKVKTLPQLVDTLKEAVGSGWTKTFSIILGDFNQARTTFTQLSDYFGGIVGASADARNQMLADWSALKGRAVMIKAVRHAWESLMSILGPIKDAFREIFPPATGEQLFHLTQAVNHFFKALVLSKDAQEDLKNTFAGLFAVIHIGLTIFQGVAHVLGTIIGLFFKSQGSTLAFTGGIGQMLVALDKFLTKGRFIEKFFNGLAIALVAILDPLVEVKNALVNAFISLAKGDPSAFFDGIGNAISSLLQLVDNLSAGFASAFNSISDALGGVGHIQGLDLSSMFGGASADGAKKGIDDIKGSLDGVASIVDKIKQAWSAFVDGLKGTATSGIGAAGNQISSTWDKVLGVLHSIGDFLKPLTDQFSNVFGTISDLISGAFSGKGLDFSDFLDAVNTGLFLAIFLTIRNFTTAISRVSKAASGVLNQVTSNLKTMQNDVRANIIIKIAAALLILAGAVFLLAQTDPKSLGLALGAVTAMLIELVAALKILEKSVGTLAGGAKLTLVAGAMVLMAVAIAAMAGAVYLFGKMDPDEMKQGLIGISAALTALTVSAAVMAKSGAGANMIGAALGLLIMSAALLALTKAIAVYSKLDKSDLATGLVKIGITIAALAIAMNLMKTGVSGAAAMYIVAQALTVMVKVLAGFAKMSWDSIGKSMTVLAGSLAILGLAMYGMQTSIGGAVALLVMVGALTLLVPVMLALGALPWETVQHGLLVFAAVMGALLVAGLAIAPVVPILIGLGLAFALFGAAVFLAGTGVAAFAAGLALLANNGSAGFAVLKAIIYDFLDSLPKMILAFGDTIDAIATVIGEKAPVLVDAFTALMGAMIDSAIRLTPKIGKLFETLIKTGLRVLVSYYSDLAEAGLQLIQHVLSSIADHVGDIAEQAGRIAVEFVKALAKQGVKFSNAALQALIDFLNGLANAINTHAAELNAAGGRVALAVISGITLGIRNAFGAVKDAIVSMLKSAAAAAKSAGSHALNIATGGLIGSRAIDALTGSFALLVGGTDQVNDALEKIKGQIKDTLESSAASVDKWKKKLKELKNHGGSPKQIKHAQDMLAEANKLQEAAEKADNQYKKIMKARGDELKGLAKQYDDMLEAIAKAEDDLKKAQDAQTAFKAGVMSTFATLPDIQAGQSLASYMRELAKQQAKVEKFKATLAALAAAGLDSTYIEQFLAEGVDAQKLMDQLLAGGPGAITQFEAASAGLKTAGQSLADLASTLLGYDQAITIAQQTLAGLKDGLADKAGLKQIEEAMRIIARKMMKALRDELDIKSPSRKAGEVGFFFVKGIINQIDDMHRDVEQSAAALGNAALDTLQATLSKVGDGVNAKISMSPVITPILDLTQLTKDANSISSLMTANPISASISLAQASDISAFRSANENDAYSDGEDRLVAVTYEQNLHSPTALDDVTIYRASKNLFSLKKEELGV